MHAHRRSAQLSGLNVAQASSVRRDHGGDRTTGYVLMHKDVKVARIDIDPHYGTIRRTAKVLDIEHMPVGTVRSGCVDGDGFGSWWSSRSIPASRDGLRDLLETLGTGDARTLLPRTMGISLSDHQHHNVVGSTAGIGLRHNRRGIPRLGRQPVEAVLRNIAESTKK